MFFREFWFFLRNRGNNFGFLSIVSCNEVEVLPYGALHIDESTQKRLLPLAPELVSPYASPPIRCI